MDQPAFRSGQRRVENGLAREEIQIRRIGVQVNRVVPDGLCDGVQIGLLAGNLAAQLGPGAQFSGVVQAEEGDRGEDQEQRLRPWPSP